jgi:hypothetical protein
LADAPRTRLFVFLILGILLVGAAAYVGHTMRVAPRLDLDLRDERIDGTATFESDGVYRLRYVHSNGSVYARRYTDGFGFRRVGEGETTLPLVYNPEQPNRFQPRGSSYPGAFITGALFLAGMASVLHARRLTRAKREKD